MNTEPDSGMIVLATDACWTLLRSTTVGRLAVVVSGHPDIFPINFVVDHGTIVFRTAVGTKLAAAVIGHVVAFEVDGYEPAAGEAWSVVIKGHVEQVTQAQEMIDTTDLPLFPWHAGPKPRFVRIVPENVSGRRFRVAATSAWDNPLAAAPRTSTD